MSKYIHPLGASSGKCEKCNKEIPAYYSYWCDRTNGNMYCVGKCSEWAKEMFLFEHGFHYYTDG